MLDALLESVKTLLPEGKESLKESLSLSKESMEKLYADAYQLYQDGQYEMAKEAFIQLVVLNPWEASYWMGLGAASQLAKDDEQALHAYAIAGYLENENPYPHYHAAQCLIVRNEHEDALKALRLAEERLRKEPRNYPGLLGRIQHLRTQIYSETEHV